MKTNYFAISAVFSILTVNIIMFMTQQFIPGFTDMFKLVSADILTRPWIIVTSMFLHGSIPHLAFNMIGLYFFGTLLEERIGTKRFLLLYFGSGILAGISATFFYHAALGASGAVMGVLGTMIILMPNLKIMFNLIIPMPLWVAGIAWAAMDIFGIFNPSNIANIAHLAGMGTGLLYGLTLTQKKQKLTKRIKDKTHLDDEDVEELLRSGRI
ncbi:MAG: rhomboid family intramembrane serine protease [Candidatus Woesearchaeota archaeon]